MLVNDLWSGLFGMAELRCANAISTQTRVNSTWQCAAPILLIYWSYNRTVSRTLTKLRNTRAKYEERND